MLTFETTNNRPNLIIFVHGFTGGKDTWIRTDGKKSILNYLKEDTFIADNFDFAIFDYFAKVTDVLTKVSGIWGFITGNPTKISKNIPVEDIGNELQSEIRYSCKKYEKIILIAHSLGGLVSKSYILKEINSNKTLPVKLFVSLAVPHRGTNLAVYGKAILNNPQVEDLQPLSDKVNELNDLWVDANDKLPKTVYCLGSYDEVVPKKSAVSSDAREKEIVFSQNDHTSIVVPESKNSVLLHAIIEKCAELISSPNNTTSAEIQDTVVPKITETHKRQDDHKTERTILPLSKKDDLKQKLSEEKYQEVIDELKVLYKNDNDARNGIFLQASRWNSLKTSIDNGVISYDNSSVERNRISLALLNLIDKI